MPGIVGVLHGIYGGSIVDRSLVEAGALTEEVDGGVAGDGEDPGALVAAGGVVLEAASPDANEGFLDGLFGEGGVAEDLDGGGEGRAGVFGDEGIEGGGVAGAEAFEMTRHACTLDEIWTKVIEVASRLRTWGVGG